MSNTKFKAGDRVRLIPGVRSMDADIGAEAIVQDPPYRTFSGNTRLMVSWDLSDARRNQQSDGDYHEAQFEIVVPPPKAAPKRFATAWVDSADDVSLTGDLFDTQGEAEGHAIELAKDHGGTIAVFERLSTHKSVVTVISERA